MPWKLAFAVISLISMLMMLSDVIPTTVMVLGMPLPSTSTVLVGHDPREVVQSGYPLYPTETLKRGDYLMVGRQVAVKGRIQAWHVLIDTGRIPLTTLRPKLRFRVFRPTSTTVWAQGSLGEHRFYRLVGENEFVVGVKERGRGVRVFRVKDPRKQIQVQAGDILGWSDESTRGMIVHGQGTQLTWSERDDLVAVNDYRKK